MENKYILIWKKLGFFRAKSFVNVSRLYETPRILVESIPMREYNWIFSSWRII